MTNSYTTEEVTLNREEEIVSIELTRMLLAEASVEAPGMHNERSGITGIYNVTGDIPLAEETQLLEEDEELIVTMGNVARARRVNPNTNSHSEDEKACEDTAELQNRTGVNGEGTSTLATEKNECTWNNDASTTTTDGGGVDDEDDYVENREEENRAYKTSAAATLSQSDHIIQEQQQHEGINALVSKVGLFLDQTWNWLHYFLVTIIFLNLVQLAERLEVAIEEVRKSVCDGEVVGAEEKQSDKFEARENSECCLEESGLDYCGKIESESINCTSALLDDLSESKPSAEVTMSPNTCSIQNQEEVEKAEEAIMAVGVASPVVKQEATSEPTADVVKLAEESNMKQPSTQQQITIILPSDDKVVVVNGEYESSEDNTSDNDLSGIRRDSVDSYTSSEGSGNLGDVETEICDKSSEDGTSSCVSGDLADDTTVKDAEVAQKIISQVESMFSDEHLAKDGFLLKHVRRRSDGFVSLKLVAGLRKVKQISREFPVVLDALKDSTKLEINPEGTKVRRVEPLSPVLKTIPIKSKDKEKDTAKDKQGGKDNGSSNDENQIPNAAVTIHQNAKSPSKTGNKENCENGQNNKQGGGHQSGRNSFIQNRKNSNAASGNQSRRSSNAQQNFSANGNNRRKSSNTSTASSNNSSRNNSFSKLPGAPLPGQHPADLFRNVYMAAYSSSGEESQSPQVGRRRGGSLPIAAMHRASVVSGCQLSPNSSPPNGSLVLGPNGARPKSNSYCEGTGPSSMSPWLQRRKASASSRLSTGELVLHGVMRQPRGPDGTKGFATGYRDMILKERLEQQQNSAVSA